MDNHKKNPSRTLRRILIPALLLLVLAACSMPQFGEQQQEAAPFDVTPYAPGEQSSATASGDAAASSQSQTADSEAGSEAEIDQTGTEQTAVDQTDDQESDDLFTDVTQINPQTGRRQYSGEIVAKSRTTVAAESSGMALEVPVEIGDKIAAGDLLLTVESSALEAQRAQAIAGLTAAQAQLDLLLDDAVEEDLEAARAAVSAASAAYRRAVEGPTEEDKRFALAQLRQAEAAVTVAQAAYNQVKGNPMIGALPQSLQLQQATLQIEAAQAQYDKVLKGTTNDVIAGAYAQLAQARAQLKRLEDGAKDAQIAAAEAQVMQAETALYLAQLQLDKSTVEAPVTGTVVEVFATIGAMVAPGAPVVAIMSPEMEVQIQVEEYRMAELAPGQNAVLLVDAYPNQLFEGEIIRIAPELDPASRTVQVTIRPSDAEGKLAPGMFTTVELVD